MRALEERPLQPRRPLLLAIAWAISLLTLQGCAPIRVGVASRPVDVSTDLQGGIRMMGADQRFSDVSIQSVARRARDRRGEAPFSILALSGGGADAAFGAGALMGLAQAGERPQFSVVTGVSAGALLAPYAFLGPEWDQQLMDANDRGEPVSSQGIGCPADDEFIGRFAVRKAATVRVAHRPAALPHRRKGGG